MICNKCKEDKIPSDFSFRIKATGKRHGICITCQRDYRKKHYETHKDQYLKKATRNRNKYKKASREYIVQYLLDHPCADCGNTDIRVLEFDHRNGSEKEYEVAKLAHGWGASLEILQAEIKKCDVRCANCHKIRHYEENGFASRDMPS